MVACVGGIDDRHCSDNHCVGGLQAGSEYKDVVRFIFQNVYYLFEAALILLTIAFGQKFGESLFKRDGLPYGGMFLALTWGLIHILLQGGATGVCVFHVAFIWNDIHNVEQECAVCVCGDCGCVCFVRCTKDNKIKQAKQQLMRDLKNTVLSEDE